MNLEQTYQQLEDELQYQKTNRKFWVRAGENRWACAGIDDIEHWFISDVFSVDDLLRFQMENDVWEAYRDAYGVRPRGIHLRKLSMGELQHMLDQCIAAIEDLRDEDLQESLNVFLDDGELPTKYEALAEQYGYH